MSEGSRKEKGGVDERKGRGRERGVEAKGAQMRAMICSRDQRAFIDG